MAASTVGSGSPGSRTSTVTTVPMTGSTRTLRCTAVPPSGARGVQRRLHRLGVALTGEGGAADDVDLGALGLQHLLAEKRERLRVDEHGLLMARSEEHTSELQSLRHLVCRLLLE